MDLEDYKQHTSLIEHKLKEVKQWNKKYGKEFIEFEIQYAQNDRKSFLDRMEGSFRNQIAWEVNSGRYTDTEQCLTICPELTLAWHKQYKPLGRAWFYWLEFLSFSLEEAVAKSQEIVAGYFLKLSEKLKLPLPVIFAPKNPETVIAAMSYSRILTLIGVIRSPLSFFEFYVKGKDHSFKLFTKNDRACDLCRSHENVKSCSRCHVRAYCSRECQTKDWPRHKKECLEYTQDRVEFLKPKKKEER